MVGTPGSFQGVGVSPDARGSGWAATVGGGGGGGWSQAPSPSAREAEWNGSCFSQPEGSMFEETTFVFKPGRNKSHSTKN